MHVCTKQIQVKLIHNHASSSEKTPSPAVVSFQNPPLYFLWGSNIMGVHLYIIQKQHFEVKNALIDLFHTYTHSFSRHKTITDGLAWCGLLVDYFDVFISCLDSHSDGTHSLQRIHW